MGSSEVIVSRGNEMARLAGPISGLAALVTAASGSNPSENPFVVGIAAGVLVYAASLASRLFGLVAILISVLILCKACGVLD